MNNGDKRRFKVPWKLVFNTCVIALTIALVAYFVFSDVGFIDLINKINSGKMQVNTVWIVMAVVAHLLNIALDSTIIYLFIKQTTPEVKPHMALVAGMVGQFFCAVTPSSTGGQPMQILTMSRMGIKASNGTSALVQKFLVWQFTLAVYCIISISFGFSFIAGKLDPTMWVLTIIGFSAQVVMIVVLLLASFAKGITIRFVDSIFRLLGKLHILKNADEKIQSINESLENFHKSNQELNKNKKLLVLIYTLTVVQMTSFFLVPYCISQAFNIDCNIFEMIFAQSYVNMVSSLMPLPGGSGAAEYSFSVFFGTYFTAETMKTAILLWRTITYYGTIVISMPFSQLHKKKNILPENIEREKEN